MSFLLHIPHPGDTGWVLAEGEPWDPEGRAGSGPGRDAKPCTAQSTPSSDSDVLQKPPGFEVPVLSAISQQLVALLGINFKEWVLLIKTRVKYLNTINSINKFITAAAEHLKMLLLSAAKAVTQHKMTLRC